MWDYTLYIHAIFHLTKQEIDADISELLILRRSNECNTVYDEIYLPNVTQANK